MVDALFVPFPFVPLTSSPLTHSPADIPRMLAGIIDLMSLIHKFSHGHHGIPKQTAGFHGIVGVGIITYLLGTIYTLPPWIPGIVYTT
jgi:hypothetical protein